MRDAPLSPLDGRYRPITQPLALHLSEEALNQARLHVEVEWFIFVLDQDLLGQGGPTLTATQREYLRALPPQFGSDDTAQGGSQGAGLRQRLAELEAETRHDVKAVEYLLREYLQESGDPVLANLGELVHFLATSEDVNNLAYALTVREAVTKVWLPAAQALLEEVKTQAAQAADVPMLARTHGQSATPTTAGKELAVFAYRLGRALKHIEAAEYLGKFNGATGTYSAHVAVLPGVDWSAVSRRFVESLGLTWNPVTTQIESHDWQVRLYGDVAHFNRIGHNLATDMWHYISLGYFRQLLSAQGSTGSSTMPHKVNPIRFENAEANFELSCALLDSLSATLATSRLQRDLSDSSAQRNIGSALGYSLVAVDNLRRGMVGVQVAEDVLAAELELHWEVLSEAIQQGFRLAAITVPPAADAGGSDDSGQQEAYEVLKEVTRGRQVTQADLHRVIGAAELPSDLRSRLLALTPATYVGLAEQVAQEVAGHVVKGSETKR